LAQVYAALAWYYDHQIELDGEIERQDKRISALRAASGPSPLQQRLAAQRRSG
jgi:hypothetical protein